MIRYEAVAGILRFYPREADPQDPAAIYEASCTVVWENPGVVWIKGLTGKLSKRHVVEFAKFILENKITKVKSYRNKGSLPFATFTDGRYCEIDVALALPKAQTMLDKYNETKAD